MADYDSSSDTLAHIRRVQQLLSIVVTRLEERSRVHDASKLMDPEKAAFDEHTPKLAALTYGTEEYKAGIAALGPALEHHYKFNSHHPEHNSRGIEGMTLLDLIEMFCDWKAASERHADGDFNKSLAINKSRFAISDQLANVFENTLYELEFGSSKRKCCVLGCGLRAQWVIEYGPTPDDFTDSCTVHLGESLNDAPEFRVYAVEDRPNG